MLHSTYLGGGLQFPPVPSNRASLVDLLFASDVMLLAHEQILQAVQLVDNQYYSMMNVLVAAERIVRGIRRRFLLVLVA